MTAKEWLASDDPIAMLNAARAAWPGEEAELEGRTHRYLLACCRAIWTLFPMEASRHGIEFAGRYLEGRITRDESSTAEWHAEGASFLLDPCEWIPDEMTAEDREWHLQYHQDRRERIAPLTRDVEAIPDEEMRRMVRIPAVGPRVSPRQLLADVAYFADFAMVYPGIRPREGAIERYPQFLSVALLREHFGDLFTPER